MSDQDSVQLSMGLQPRGQIHLVANDGVVHPVLAAEIADGAEARIDPDAQLEWLFRAQIQPLELQLAHPPLHGDRHLDAGNGVLFASPARRIAEKNMIASPTDLSIVAP